MIIHQPELSAANGQVRLFARVELQSRAVRVPESLWFEIPEQYAPFIATTADGFAVALLPLAMTLGEDLQLRGALSPRLAQGICEYQHTLASWFPQQLKVIQVHSERYQSPLSNGAKSAAVAFSGGVDSFYSLWRHLPQNEARPEHQVQYGLFVQGFDIDLADDATYQIARASYGKLMRELGLELLTVRTNTRQFLLSVEWGIAHGAALIGQALLFAPLLSRFYVPATFSERELEPYGSDPRIDPLLSTETLAIIHDGIDATRVEKVRVLAEWDATYTRLRVCFKRVRGLENCCRCAKCIRTMIALDLVGALAKYETFPLPLRRWHVRAWRFPPEDPIFAHQLLAFATAVGRQDVVFDLRCAFLWAPVRWRLRPLKARLTRAI